MFVPKHLLDMGGILVKYPLNITRESYVQSGESSPVESLFPRGGVLVKYSLELAKYPLRIAILSLGSFH